MSLLLDTTVLIDALRGLAAGERIRHLRLTGQRPWTCAVSVEEVHRGLRAAERASAAALFDGLRLAPLGRIEGERSGDWRRTFAEKGITLAQPDSLIAAAAVSVGARLATGNPKDFPMEELAVEHWPVGA